MLDNFDQAVNFHFNVSFKFTGQADDNIDIRFQSVTGLDSTLETETVKEGGENRFEHVIPVRRKYGPLTLKRGLLKPGDSKLTDWLKEAFDNEKVMPISSLVVSLLDPDHKDVLHWTLSNVWPKSWKVGELNAERGEVLIETLELNYNRLLFDK